MGLYTSGFLDSRDIVAGFFPALEAAKELAWWNQLTEKVSTDREVDTYRWLGQVPVMREWVGGRHLETLAKYNMSITNKKYEATLAFSVDDLRRDKTPQIRTRIADLARRTVTFPNSLLSTLITNSEAGVSGLAYDGQFFIDTDHAESGTNQTNDLTSTEVPAANVSNADAPTAVEAADIITQTVAWMKYFTDDKGEPINQDVTDWAIMVGSSIYAAAFENALSQRFLTGSVTNPVDGLKASGYNFRVIANPRLSATADKVYFFGRGALPPFILQEELPLQTQLIGPGSEEEFHNDQHIFGVKWIGNAGYAMWQTAALVTLS